MKNVIILIYRYFNSKIVLNKKFSVSPIISYLYVMDIDMDIDYSFIQAFEQRELSYKKITSINLYHYSIWIFLVNTNMKHTCSILDLLRIFPLD